MTKLLALLALLLPLTVFANPPCHTGRARMVLAKCCADPDAQGCDDPKWADIVDRCGCPEDNGPPPETDFTCTLNSSAIAAIINGVTVQQEQTLQNICKATAEAVCGDSACSPTINVDCGPRDVKVVLGQKVRLSKCVKCVLADAETGQLDCRARRRGCKFWILPEPPKVE